MSCGKAESIRHGHGTRWAAASALAAAAVHPPTVLAVQVHGAPEGLYVHQMAHVLFAAALLFLLYILHYRPIGSGTAWRFFKLSILFFLAWNIDAFVVHWLALGLSEEYFVGGPLLAQRLAGPIDAERLVYYLGRFDHLLCLPAMYFLIRSLDLFSREALDRRREGKAQGP